MNSTHTLVRLLKSSTDPPTTPGPSKIEIACLAWSDPSFRAANKGEVIGEWILTVLAQAKKTGRERDISTDARYWTLLSDVLTTPPPTTARPIKTWLLPLLNRIQLDTLVTDLLASHPSQLLRPARTSLAVLWPLAEKKISIDALGVCLGAVFDACAVWERADEDLIWISSAIVGTYRTALANAGNKKKLYSSFLTTHLSSWLRAIHTTPSLVNFSSIKQLQDSIYTAGTDTLFSLDALKQPLDTLFDALSSSSSTMLLPSLLPALPKLFTSFLSLTYRHRSALFATASGAIGGKEELRKNGMEFVSKCWSLIQGSARFQEDFTVERWKSIIGLFEIVEKERLFTYSTHAAHINDSHGGELALSKTREKAIEMLENIVTSSKDCRVEQAVLSMQLLGTLVRIEYDFIGLVLERVLAALINVTPTTSQLLIAASSDLLMHVLEYHTKTRTMHTYTLALLDAVVASSSSTAWTTASLSMTCKFSLAFHLPTFARALRTALTPTQNSPLATAVLQAVENAWTAVKNLDQEGERRTKERKSVADTDKGERKARTMQARARAFYYTSRIAGTVLSNLSPHAYGEYSSESLWREVGKLGWTIIWECLIERTKGDDHRVKTGKKRRHVGETLALPGHYPHIIISGTLRVLYDVRARVSFLLGDCDKLGGPDVETLLDVVRDSASEPELVLEIIRTLFWHVWYTHNCESQEQIETQPVFTVTLDILTTYISPTSTWSGVSADLSRDNLGLAILYVLTHRWIDLLDALAPTESLERLVSLLLVVPIDRPDEFTQESADELYLQRDNAVITLRGILLKLLRNAQFWELHNIRAVFLSYLLGMTAPLSYCFPAAGVEVESHLPTAVAQTEFVAACSVYGLVYYVPLEYFTRPVRTELVKRAMAADIQICAALVGIDRQRETSRTVESEEWKNWLHRLMFVRAFLQHMGQFLSTANQPVAFAFVTHLLQFPPSVLSPSKALMSVTVDLIQSHVASLLRSQEPEAATSISGFISTLIAAGPFSHPISQETSVHVLVQSTILKLIEQLTSDFYPASLPDEVKRSLKTLVEALESTFLPHARQLMKRDTLELHYFLSSERVIAWCHILSLTRWLGVNSQSVPIPIGLKLATSMIRSQNFTKLHSETCPSVFRLLYEELWCMANVSHRDHLDVLVGFYVVNGDHLGSGQAERILDTQVTQATKKLSVEDFSHLLDVLAEGIDGGGILVGHRERIIHFAKVILHDAPQGTLKAIQNFVTRCFSLFSDREDIYGGASSLKMQCLGFIARHCSDRPMAIRSTDLGNIWSLLNKTLSGSSEHDATTMFSVFHHIATIVGALIRLRRDLVIHTLPHLGLILRQLMMLTRKIRPQLGAKQSKIVTDTFPSWLSASEPLSTDEARALARLLTSLTTKTVPRTHALTHLSTSTEPQKAESLAKPFAKHASHVLVAYVDAFNDPLCIMNAEMRRELEPGLFALCEMVGEHSRDALMVSTLDSGGKTIMKSLWRDYEKQRYVGKG